MLNKLIFGYQPIRNEEYIEKNNKANVEIYVDRLNNLEKKDKIKAFEDFSKCYIPPDRRLKLDILG
jgi:ADP-dependent phosphofructokinase/glucokinase